MISAGVMYFPPDIFDPRLVETVDSESKDIGGHLCGLFDSCFI